MDIIVPNKYIHKKQTLLLMYFFVDISDEQRDSFIFHGELIWRNTRQMLEKVPKRPRGLERFG